jgi:hypothetical protein
MRIGMLLKDIGGYFYYEYTGKGTNELCGFKVFVHVVSLFISMICFAYIFVFRHPKVFTCLFLLFLLPTFLESVAYLRRVWWESYDVRIFRIKYLVPIKDMPLYLNDELIQVRKIAADFIKGKAIQ